MKKGPSITRVRELLDYAPATGVFTVRRQHRVRSNDAIANLRLATKCQNNSNRRVFSNSLTGVKGVRRKGRSYQARYQRQANILFGEFAT